MFEGSYNGYDFEDEYYYEYGGGAWFDQHDYEGPVLDDIGGGGFFDEWLGPIDIGYTIGVTVEDESIVPFPEFDPWAPDITGVFSDFQSDVGLFPDIDELDLGLGGGFIEPDITDIFNQIDVPDIFDVPVVTDKDVGLPTRSIWDKIGDALKSIAGGITGGGSGGGSGGGGIYQPQQPKTADSSMLPWLLAGGAALLLLSKDDKKK